MTPFFVDLISVMVYNTPVTEGVDGFVFPVVFGQAKTGRISATEISRFFRFYLQKTILVPVFAVVRVRKNSSEKAQKDAIMEIIALHNYNADRACCQVF